MPIVRSSSADDLPRTRYDRGAENLSQWSFELQTGFDRSQSRIGCHAIVSGLGKPAKTLRLAVSVAICCHNSEKLLPSTLSGLKEQRVSRETSWEVIVVDNASSDRTAEVARKIWGSDSPAQLRVIYEPRPGLKNKRQRAFKEARYEVVSFVDDDNWVGPD